MAKEIDYIKESRKALARLKRQNLILRKKFAELVDRGILKEPKGYSALLKKD